MTPRSRLKGACAASSRARSRRASSTASCNVNAASWTGSVSAPPAVTEESKRATVSATGSDCRAQICGARSPIREPGVGERAGEGIEKDLTSSSSRAEASRSYRPRSSSRAARKRRVCASSREWSRSACNDDGASVHAARKVLASVGSRCAGSFSAAIDGGSVARLSLRITTPFAREDRRHARAEGLAGMKGGTDCWTSQVVESSSARGGGWWLSSSAGFKCAAKDAGV